MENVKPIRISCIGDSITAGTGCTGDVGSSDKNGKPYPSRLQFYLDKKAGEGKYLVSNFGKPCAAAIEDINICDTPYVLQEQYKNSLLSKPDIVLSMFGANDAHAWARDGDIIEKDFIKGYRRLLYDYSSLTSHPRVIILLPIIAIRAKIAKVYDEKMLELIKDIAVKENIELFDIQDFTKEDKWSLDNYMHDDIHPNDAGYDRLGEKVADLLLNLN